MFRFIHSADLHIDSPLSGLDQYQYEGAPVETLRGATRRALENMVQLAIDESVQFVVIAGDVFDGDWRDFQTGLFFTRQMKRLSDAGISVWMISGNHDADSVLTTRLQLPDNVHQFSTRKAETRLLDDLPVAIHGRGFTARSVPDNLVPGYPAPVSGRFNIGLLHTSLDGDRGHPRYAPCSLSDLTARGYDYWALGHVHQPEILSREPWIVFPGNLQGRHIRETGMRGCRLITVDDELHVRQHEFRAVDVVRWQRVDVEISRLEDMDQVLTETGAALVQAEQAAEGRLLAVRLVLKGASPLHGRLISDPAELRAACKNQAQVSCGDQVWLEEIEVRTVPLYDLQELAERDDLTRIVLESLDRGRHHELEVPPAVQDLLKLLPPELREISELELQPDQRGGVLDDVTAILLDALTSSGTLESRGSRR